MRYCVYKLWKGARIEQVLEYFSILPEAEAYYRQVKRSKQYEVHIGEFV
jgi:hypothetical protein